MTTTYAQPKMIVGIQRYSSQHGANVSVARGREATLAGEAAKSLSFGGHFRGQSAEAVHVETTLMHLNRSLNERIEAFVLNQNIPVAKLVPLSRAFGVKADVRVIGRLKPTALYSDDE